MDVGNRSVSDEAVIRVSLEADLSLEAVYLALADLMRDANSSGVPTREPEKK